MEALVSQWEIPEPWEFAEGLERWEETKEKRFNRVEKPEDEYPEPWEWED